LETIETRRKGDIRALSEEILRDGKDRNMLRLAKANFINTENVKGKAHPEDASAAKTAQENQQFAN
jgi:hypothetical protein